MSTLTRVKALIVAMSILVSCSPVASPSPTPVASTATPLPTAAPTATVGAGLTRYVNSELGFSVDTPIGWRRAACSSGVLKTSPLDAGEFLTSAPESEETIGGGVRLIGIQVVDAAGLTPLAWLQQGPSQPDTRYEPVTLNGRSAARGFIGATGATYTYVVAARGWIYSIGWPYFGGPDQELEGIIATFRILDDAALGRAPVTTPVPRTIEAVADGLADAFTRKDLAAITGVLAPCVTVGGVPGDALLRSRSAYVASLGVDFASGRSVQMRARPIEDDPYLGRFVRSTFTKPGEADQRVDFILRADGDRWAVVAILTRGLGN